MILGKVGKLGGTLAVVARDICLVVVVIGVWIFGVGLGNGY